MRPLASRSKMYSLRSRVRSRPKIARASASSSLSECSSAGAAGVGALPSIRWITGVAVGPRTGASVAVAPWADACATGGAAGSAATIEREIVGGIGTVAETAAGAAVEERVRTNDIAGGAAPKAVPETREPAPEAVQAPGGAQSSWLGRGGPDRTTGQGVGLASSEPPAARRWIAGATVRTKDVGGVTALGTGAAWSGVPTPKRPDEPTGAWTRQVSTDPRSTPCSSVGEAGPSPRGASERPSSRESQAWRLALEGRSMKSLLAATAGAAASTPASFAARPPPAKSSRTPGVWTIVWIGRLPGSGRRIGGTGRLASGTAGCPCAAGARPGSVARGTERWIGV